MPIKFWGLMLAIILIYILEVGSLYHGDGSVFVGAHFLGYLKRQKV
jgi:hypothetical protein